MEASSRSIGVGVIGCGGMGRSHALAFKTDPRARIICVADTDRERAKALAEEVKAEEYTDDYRALLQNPKVDAVSIVTPNHLHAQMSIEAAEGGKHILCEKPMALTVKECDEMIASARRAGVVLAIGYVLRFFSVLQATKNLIVSDEAGAVKNISVIRWGGGLPRGWYREAEKLGGIVGVVCHEVDMLRWLAGEVKSVRLEADCLFGEVNYEDNIWMLFRFKSGAVGSLGWSLTSNIGIYEYAILGLKESLRVYPGKAGSLGLEGTSRGGNRF